MANSRQTKREIRARMARTGEGYMVAMHHLEAIHAQTLERVNRTGEHYLHARELVESEYEARARALRERHLLSKAGCADSAKRNGQRRTGGDHDG